MFANPRTFSQLTASFIAARSLGIHRLPFYTSSREIVFTPIYFVLLLADRFTKNDSSRMSSSLLIGYLPRFTMSMNVSELLRLQVMPDLNQLCHHKFGLTSLCK